MSDIMMIYLITEQGQKVPGEWSWQQLDPQPVAVFIDGCILIQWISWVARKEPQATVSTATVLYCFVGLGLTQPDVSRVSNFPRLVLSNNITQQQRQQQLFCKHSITRISSLLQRKTLLYFPLPAFKNRRFVETTLYSLSLYADFPGNRLRKHHRSSLSTFEAASLPCPITFRARSSDISRYNNLLP